MTRLGTPKLRELVCSGNPELASLELDVLPADLVTVDLSLCPMLATDRITALLDALVCVNRMDLSGTALSSELFASIISRCPVLQTLTATGCPGLSSIAVESESLRELDVSSSTKLTRLSLSAPYLVSLRASVCQLLASVSIVAPRLQRLELNKCPLLKDDSISLKIEENFYWLGLDGNQWIFVFMVSNCACGRLYWLARVLVCPFCGAQAVRAGLRESCVGETRVLSINNVRSRFREVSHLVFRLDMYGCAELVTLSLSCPSLEELGLAYCSKVFFAASSFASFLTSLVSLSRSMSWPPWLPPSPLSICAALAPVIVLCRIRCCCAQSHRSRRWAG